MLKISAYSGKESKEFQKHYKAVQFCIEHELSYPKETSEFFKGKLNGDNLEDIAPEYVLKYIENGVQMKMEVEYERKKVFIRVKEIPVGCDTIIVELD